MASSSTISKGAPGPIIAWRRSGPKAGPGTQRKVVGTLSLRSYRAELDEGRVVDVFEGHLYRQTDLDIIGIYLDQIGCELRAFLELDYRDDVWNAVSQPGMSGPAGHGEGEHGGPS
jgi:hypothetical protein